jgi:hypothetical protein
MTVITRPGRRPKRTGRRRTADWPSAAVSASVLWLARRMPPAAGLRLPITRNRTRRAVAEPLKGSGLCGDDLPYELVITNPKDLEISDLGLGDLGARCCIMRMVDKEPRP